MHTEPFIIKTARLFSLILKVTLKKECAHICVNVIS